MSFRMRLNSSAITTINPKFAEQYLELIEGCKICGGAEHEAESHTTEEHSEDWVNLADARYTGEVIFMPANLIHEAIEALGIPNTMNERVLTHVDRRIVQAIVDSFEYIDDDGGLAEALARQLADNPKKEMQ